MSYAEDFAHPDPIVREVIDVWLPRFLGGGITIGDLTNTLRRVESWPDWGREWMATGAIHETRATEAEAAGRTKTAAEAWETAARCHHLAYFLSVREPAVHDEGMERMLACYDRAMPGLTPPVEKVTIEGPDGLRMVALLSVLRPGAPIVIVLPGLDSTKETRHSARGGWMGRGFGRNGRWYPAVLEGSPEFGQMSDPRVIIQKGENIKVPEKKQRQRLVTEHLRGSGSSAGQRPVVRFVRDLLPSRDAEDKK